MPVVKQVAKRLGRRGICLVITGTIWVFYGSGIVAQTRERFSKVGPSPLDWMDNHNWGWLWIVSGLVAIVVGLLRRAAPDAIGFAAAVLPVLPWSMFYLYSWMVFKATAGQFGEPGTWQPFLVWALIGLYIRNQAGWDDPADPVVRGRT